MTNFGQNRLDLIKFNEALKLSWLLSGSANRQFVQLR